MTDQAEKKQEVAWSCKDCGHILGQTSAKAPTGHCPECKADPAHWLSAPVTGERIDLGYEGAAGSENYNREEISGNDPAGPFATSPAGVEGEDVNPELRVRY